MAITQNVYTGNGSTTFYSFTFPYLETTDIKVTVNGVPTTAYTLANATTIQFNSAPANGATIRIYRQTDDSASSATFYPGSVIRAQDLNDNFTQSLYVAQEVNNNAVQINGNQTMVGNLNMGGFDVINLATQSALGYARWRKVATNGQTVFSGTGDSGGVLEYLPLREQVFINGVLQQRDVDYSASNGTTITFNVGLTVGDIVEVVCINSIKEGSLDNASEITYDGQFTGQSTRTVAAKLADVVSVKDFGAVGNGVADDTAAVTAAKNAITSQVNGVLLASGGEFSSTGTIWSNNVQPTSMPMSRPGVLGVFEGTQVSPDTKDRGPSVWVQKYTKYDSDGDRFNHNAGAVFGEVNVLGTGVSGSNDTEGTWIGILGNAVLNGINQGTSGAPDYDAFGSTVGVAGFARTTGYPGDGNIVCGVWGYAQGPTLDTTTQSNLPATNWSLVGVESNIQINHQDIGEQSVIVGKGSSVGFLAFNYRAPNTGKIDWTFGIALNGNPNDGNYSSTNIDNWNGFYCGILIDKIKSKGIRFGQYMKTGSYGIYFPDTYIGTLEPAAAIYLGNSKIAMGQYVGSTFNNGDFWHNGGQLYWQYGGTTRRALTHNQANGTLQTSTKIDFQTNGSNIQFSIGALANSVNYLTAFGAATTATPALIADGSDTNIDIELRPKGTGRVWVGAWTTNADAPVSGYITVKDSSGVVRKLATIT